MIVCLSRYLSVHHNDPLTIISLGQILESKLKLRGGEIPNCLYYLVHVTIRTIMSRYYRLCTRLYNITRFSIHVLSNPPPHLTGASFVKYSKIVERTYVSSTIFNQSNYKPQFQKLFQLSKIDLT